MDPDTIKIAVASTVLYGVLLIAGMFVTLPANRSLTRRLNVKVRHYQRVQHRRLDAETEAETGGSCDPEISAQNALAVPTMSCRECCGTPEVLVMWALSFIPSVLLLGIIGSWICYAYDSLAGTIVFLVVPGVLLFLLLIAFCIVTGDDDYDVEDAIENELAMREAMEEAPQLQVQPPVPVRVGASQGARRPLYNNAQEMSNEMWVTNQLDLGAGRMQGGGGAGVRWSGYPTGFDLDTRPPPPMDLTHAMHGDARFR